MTKRTDVPARTNLPASAEPPQPLPVDEWHGMGGEYVIENGERRRVAGPPVGPDTTPAEA